MHACLRIAPPQAQHVDIVTPCPVFNVNICFYVGGGRNALLNVFIRHTCGLCAALTMMPWLATRRRATWKATRAGGWRARPRHRHGRSGFDEAARREAICHGRSRLSIQWPQYFNANSLCSITSDVVNRPSRALDTNHDIDRYGALM